MQPAVAPAPIIITAHRTEATISTHRPLFSSEGARARASRRQTLRADAPWTAARHESSPPSGTCVVDARKRCRLLAKSQDERSPGRGRPRPAHQRADRESALARPPSPAVRTPGRAGSPFAFAGGAMALSVSPIFADGRSRSSRLHVGGCGFWRARAPGSRPQNSRGVHDAAAGGGGGVSGRSAAVCARRLCTARRSLGRRRDIAQLDRGRGRTRGRWRCRRTALLGSCVAILHDVRGAARSGRGCRRCVAPSAETSARTRRRRLRDLLDELQPCAITPAMVPFVPPIL